MKTVPTSRLGSNIARFSWPGHENGARFERGDADPARTSSPRVDVTDERSGCRSSVRVEHGLRSAAAHELAVVAPVGVVAMGPALELVVEVSEMLEALPVEGRAAELLKP